VRAVARQRGERAHEACGNRRGEHGDQLLQQRVLARKRVTEPRGGFEVVEGDDRVDPLRRLRQRDLDFGDDPRCPICVDHLLYVVAAQLERARRRLHRQHPRAEHVAAIAQAAPGYRADAARPAADEAAERRVAQRGRVHPLFLPGVALRRQVEIAEAHAGFGARHATPDEADPAQRRQIEHDAAPHRHRLAVVAGA
jgi:hypothetical protein